MKSGSLNMQFACVLHIKYSKKLYLIKEAEKHIAYEEIVKIKWICTFIVCSVFSDIFV